MPSKSINTNFFRLVDGNDRPVDITSNLTNIVSQTIRQRNFDYNNDLLRLQEWQPSPSNRFDYGLLIRLRMNREARKAHQSQPQIGFIRLAPGEALSEWTYFIYARDTRTIAATINRFAASPEALASYMEAKCSLSQVDVAYYPTGELVERMFRLNEIDRIALKIMVPEDLSVFQDQVLLPDLYAASLAQKRTQTVEIVLTAKSGGFETGAAGYINSFLRVVQGQNSGCPSPKAKLTVRGRKLDDAREEINFVRDRLRSVGNVQYTGTYPTHMNYWEALVEVYGSNEGDIRRWFPET